ncbi:MAG: hypothetical protein H0X38_03300, partial [Planctomycetes bacterium]|nr:hypothetical protein [Planctomycetota bacterium]
MRDPGDGSDPDAGSALPALRWLPPTVFAALAVVILILAAHQHPPASGDSLGIAPAAINAANGRGLINDFWPQTMRYDASGQARFVYHGFLPVLAYAGVLRCLPGPATAPAAYLINGVFQVAALAACWWAWTALMRHCGRLDGRGRLLIGAGLLAVATPLLGWGFRPEIITSLVVALGLRAVRAAPARWRWGVAGMTLG